MPQYLYKNESDIPPRIRAAYTLERGRYVLRFKGHEDFSPFFIWQAETYGEQLNYDLPCDVVRHRAMPRTPSGDLVGSFPNVHAAEEFLIELALAKSPKDTTLEEATALHSKI